MKPLLSVSGIGLQLMFMCVPLSRWVVMLVGDGGTTVVGRKVQVASERGKGS